ncbi:MAG: DUF1028 domain-containing protein [Bacteroidales bacterium]|nr:DUF1028 domain-containing protein [Bacteroidales bacterium]
MKSSVFALMFIFLQWGLVSTQAQEKIKKELAHTFSIVAMDSITGEMAIGVQSHWFGVGTIVSWGKSGVGVVATQSFVNPAYGPDGLALMENGTTADDALKQLVALDEGREYRQVAMLDKYGNVDAYTGSKCVASAAQIIGKYYSVQANMMLNDNVVPAMAETFEKTDGLPLAERVLQVLKAAQYAGGDIRGRQSAAIIVVGPEISPNLWSDKKIDLRVDDHPEPLEEIGRLLKVHQAYEYMNKGDLAIEHGDMQAALRAYGAAEAMMPDNLEMKYWKAIALANNGRTTEALPVFKTVFEGDENWRELTRRLPASGLLEIPEHELKEILELECP